MVERSGNGNLLIPLNLSLLSLNRNLQHSADSKDTSLWRVDNGSEALNSGVHAQVGDGEGSALVLVGLELAIAGLGSKRFDLRRDGLEALAVGILDDGGHEAGGGGDGDGNVSVRVLADNTLLLEPGRVDGGDLEESGGDTLDEEVVDGELILAIPGRSVEGLAELEELGDGEVGRDVVVGVGDLGLSEPRGDNLAHVGEGNVDKGGASGDASGSASSASSSARWLVFLDISLGDPSVLASALDVIEWDALLRSDAPGERGSKDPVTALQRSLQLSTTRLGLLSRWSRGGLRLGLWLLLLLLGLLLLWWGRLLGSSGILNAKVLEGLNIGGILN